MLSCAQKSTLNNARLWQHNFYPVIAQRFCIDTFTITVMISKLCISIFGLSFPLSENRRNIGRRNYSVATSYHKLTILYNGKLSFHNSLYFVI